MKRILLLSVVFLLGFYTEIMAQGRTITGKVTSEADGTAIPGVSIVLQGTSTGTVTDVDGEYQLRIPENGGTLQFSFVGFATKEVEIGNRSVINVVLATDVRQLTEVVVTALGISREKASLGYATQTLDNEAISQVKQPNIVNSLSGKISGIQIRQNNTFGGSTNIIVRGNNSVTGDNQPLFVVDGIPIDNRTGNNENQEEGRRGYDFGNAASDINPDNVASISVLKGAAATALYGSRAANGAVIITTKKGKNRKGIGIDFSTSYTAGVIDKSTFIEYQNRYGGGYGPYYGSTGAFDEYDVDGDGVDDLVVPTYEDASYGGELDGTEVWQWDSFWPESEHYGEPYPYRAAEHTPVDFFETSHTYNNTISLYGGNEDNTFRVSYTNYKSTGILPNSEMNKHNFNINTSTAINEKLRADVLLNFYLNNTTGRYSTGYSDNLMSNFRQWWQVNVDIEQLRRLYERSGGLNRTWNLNQGSLIDQSGMGPIFWDNPYFTRYKNYSTDSRTRIMGKIALTYDIADWISVMARFAADNYNELREERRAIGSVPTEFGINELDEESGYDRVDRFVSEYNFDVMLTIEKDLSSDLNLYALLGANIRRNNFESVRNSTSGGLVVPGLFTLSNSALPQPIAEEEITKKEVYGYFTNLNFGFRNFLFLDLVGRVDVSSALPVENNAYPYGSASLALAFSELVDIDWLSFGKVRLSYAEVGNDTDPNRTIDSYERNSNFGSAAIHTTSEYKRNPELKPERLKSWETGIELSAWQDRLRLDVALYKTNATDQIIEVATSYATGYGYKYVNGGEIQNKGIEVSLGGDILRTGGFTWSANINWAKNVSLVKSLPDVDNYVISDFQATSVNVTVGEPYGVLRGIGFQYLNGQRVVNSDGFYVSVADQIIGNPNPDWNGGIVNRLSYKGFTLSFLVDVQHGGDVFSLDMHYGQGTGLPDYTAGTNELGNPVRDPVTDDENSGGIILDGVLEDGTPNNIRADASSYAGVWYWGDAERNPEALTVYDASYIKLRELSLSYSLPDDLINTFAQNISISFIGRNLWIIDKNLPFADPESGLGAGNGQGYISGAYPTVKNYGVKLDFNF